MADYIPPPESGEADAAYLAAADRAARRAAGVRPPLEDFPLTPTRVAWAGDERLRLLERARAAAAATYAAAFGGPEAVAAAEWAAVEARAAVAAHERELGGTLVLLLAGAAAHMPAELADAIVAAGAAKAADLGGVAGVVEGLLARVRDLEAAVAAGVSHGR